MKRKLISALCLLLMLSVMLINAYAQEEPDLSRTGSISVAMLCEGEAVPGGSLTIFRVAEVIEENGADYSFRYTPEFADCAVSLDNLGDSATALALAEYAAANSIPGTKSQIDAEGHVTFTDLPLGLYLMVQEDAAEGYAPVYPFLVSLPGLENGSYVYDVDASPKLSLEQLPTEPTEPTTPPTEPPPPDIPQTGLNQWPIPVLVISGTFLLMLGVILVTSGRKRPHED